MALHGIDMGTNNKICILALLEFHITPPQTDFRAAGFLDNGDSVNAERCVHGMISTTHFQRHQSRCFPPP